MASRERLRTLRIAFPGSAQTAGWWSAAAQIEIYAADGGSKKHARRLLEKGLAEVEGAGNQSALQRAAAELGIVLDCGAHDQRRQDLRGKSHATTGARKRKEPPSSDTAVPRCSLSAPAPAPAPTQVQAQVPKPPPPRTYQQRQQGAIPTCLRRRGRNSGKRVCFGANQAVEFVNGSPSSAMTPVSNNIVARWYPRMETTCAHDNDAGSGIGAVALHVTVAVAATGSQQQQQQQQEQEQQTDQRQHLHPSHCSARRRLLSTAQQARLRESATERRFLGGWHAQSRMSMTKAQA